MVAALEEDKEFAKKLENASIDHIKSGAIADELHFVDHNVRSKLDELKRIEMERLRKLTVKEKHLKDQIERESSNGGEDDRKWRTVGGSSSSRGSTSVDITAGTSSGFITSPLTFLSFHFLFLFLFFFFGSFRSRSASCFSVS